MEANSRPRLTYVGHATVLVELDGTRLLTDPLLRGRIAHLRRQGPDPVPSVWADLDAVLVSHLHLDHLDLPSMRMIGAGARVIGPRGAGRFLEGAGFESVTELAPGHTANVGDTTVAAVPAKHSGRRRPLGPSADSIGFEINGSRRIYFAGDTDVFPEMEELEGGLDVALLPVWGWGPSLGTGHLDPVAAAKAATLLRPRIAIPIHWGTFFPFGLARLRPERLRKPPIEFAGLMSSVAPGVEVRVLAPGETTTV
jgi:L-ascorbate metabolism protein UlaG (beta-lactamase superfamily)